MGLRIGVDVGGTFTDFLVSNERGETEIFKTSTTPDDPSRGFFRGLEKIATARGFDVTTLLNQVDTIVHGTTITTNATLTGNGAKTGFVTTAGFRDVLNMRRGLKERQFEKYAAPKPLVPRHLVRVVEERVNYRGEILTPLNEADVHVAAAYFRGEKVEAIAVSLLWSFLNPTHERRIGDILSAELPGVYISLSSEVLPQIRLYERHSTTALNAYVGPVLTRYLTRLRTELTRHGFTGNLLIMQSNGGVMTPEVAQRFASNTLLSGPAGAPMAGVHYGSTHGFKNVITVDMGGTSFDAALVKNATPSVTTEGAIGEHRLASPILDIHTVGAGGGSIAAINTGGMLSVGPQSAGAVPGPALYGRGGTLPTVTDAQYVLGYLDPMRFEAGELNVDAAAARRAIETQVAQPLGLDLVTAAHGIYEIVNHKMAAALEVVSVQRGYDPREFVLIVAGGAGPIHAAALARELDIPLLLIPRESSVFCAAGMLIADLKHDYVRTYATELSSLQVEALRDIISPMIESARTTLRAEGLSPNQISFKFSADLRYVGQFNEVEVAIDNPLQIAATDIPSIAAAFHARHDALYGYAMSQAPVELINLRVTALGATQKPALEKHSLGGRDSSAARTGTRAAFFDGVFMDVSIYDGFALQPGNSVSGPAIVVQPTTTIIVPPDFDLVCDEYMNYLMHRKGAELAALIAQLHESR